MFRHLTICILMFLLIAACGNRNPDNDSATSVPDNARLASTDAPPVTTIETRDYIIGPDDAPVTIIMYGDFQCLRCGEYARDLEILRTEFPESLRLIWRHLPDTQSNDKSELAFRAAEAAAAEGKFWDMYALLFADQSTWIDLSPEDFAARLQEYARLIGLDPTQFEQRLNNERYASLIEEYQEQATELEIVGIPVLLINGSPLNDRDDLFGLRGAIHLALLSERWFDAVPEMALEPGIDYGAVIETEEGEIALDLFEAEAPIAVNNFIFLAEQGWYDETTFFLVIPGFYAQAGDPSETGRGYPGYRIPDEHDNGLVFDREGLVAMSHPRGEIDSAGSQFFITLDSLPDRETEWDGEFTIFGEVTDGMSIVQNFRARNPGDPLRFPNPPPGDLIITIHITRQ